ncbi:MAG: iron-sulfur cluster assembly accessory protein [Candidatus Kapabacteria bacterium]|nr:iron-sulfur cluster assembly accessory protein [Candidatus Kapabacteria bacterium]
MFETGAGLQVLNTGIDGAVDTDVIKISDSAISEINKIRETNSISEDFFLRLGTSNNGCSGMNYILGFDSDMDEGDVKFNMDKFDVVIDNKSLFYFMGVTLDFVNGADGSGFVFNSPYHEKTCGCSH